VCLWLGAALEEDEGPLVPLYEPSEEEIEWWRASLERDSL
jgi:hypothetical protein